MTSAKADGLWGDKTIEDKFFHFLDCTRDESELFRDGGTPAQFATLAEARICAGFSWNFESDQDERLSSDCAAILKGKHSEGNDNYFSSTSILTPKEIAQLWKEAFDPSEIPNNKLRSALIVNLLKRFSLEPPERHLPGLTHFGYLSSIPEPKDVLSLALSPEMCNQESGRRIVSALIDRGKKEDPKKAWDLKNLHWSKILETANTHFKGEFAYRILLDLARVEDPEIYDPLLRQVRAKDGKGEYEIAKDKRINILCELAKNQPKRVLETVFPEINNINARSPRDGAPSIFSDLVPDPKVLLGCCAQYGDDEMHGKLLKAIRLRYLEPKAATDVLINVANACRPKHCNDILELSTPEKMPRVYDRYNVRSQLIRKMDFQNYKGVVNDFFTCRLDHRRLMEVVEEIIDHVDNKKVVSPAEGASSSLDTPLERGKYKGVADAKMNKDERELLILLKEGMNAIGGEGYEYESERTRLLKRINENLQKLPKLPKSSVIEKITGFFSR